jgi:hypothetical protein
VNRRIELRYTFHQLLSSRDELSVPHFIFLLILVDRICRLQEFFFVSLRDNKLRLELCRKVCLQERSPVGRESIGKMMSKTDCGA